MKKFTAALAAWALACCMALAVQAAGLSTAFTVTPEQKEAATGSVVTLDITNTQSDLDVAAAMFTFTIPDGFVFEDVEKGSGVKGSELSYSYSGNELILLYLDSDGGGSPLQPGGELAKIKVRAASAGTTAPIVCTETDVSAVDAAGEVQSLDASVTVENVQVMGEPVALPTAAPSAMEQGEQKTALLQDAASGAENSAEALQNQTAEKPEETAEPQPTPTYITDAEGNRVEIQPAPTAEPNDITDKVLSAQPATSSDADAPAAQTEKQPFNPTVPIAVAVVVVLAAAGFWFMKRRK